MHLSQEGSMLAIFSDLVSKALSNFLLRVDNTYETSRITCQDLFETSEGWKPASRFPDYVHPLEVDSATSTSSARRVRVDGEADCRSVNEASNLVSELMEENKKLKAKIRHQENALLKQSVSQVFSHPVTESSRQQSSLGMVNVAPPTGAPVDRKKRPYSELIHHIVNCHSKSCDVPHCSSTHQTMNHFVLCKRGNCHTCLSVKQIWASRLQNLGRIPNKLRTSPESLESTDLPSCELHQVDPLVTGGTAEKLKISSESSESLDSRPSKESREGSLVHRENLPFRCEHCKSYFKHKRGWYRHMKLHTSYKKHHCSEGKTGFSHSKHLKVHMKTHENAKPCKCSIYNMAAEEESNNPGSPFTHPCKSSMGFAPGKELQLKAALT